MKTLFTAFLNISMTGSIVIVLVLLLRLVFQKAPKGLICLLWTIAVIRLLVPLQIETPWSFNPELPQVSSDMTQVFMEGEIVSEDELPEFVPQVKVENTFGTWMVKVDYIAIAAAVWSVGVCLLTVYMLISYLLLKHRVRNSVVYEDGVFISQDLDTAFLLGYFRPRIYLPAGMDEQTASLVISHERAHQKRCDNWLKLLGFICTALHWYNPLVWIAYILLCRDIEDACDELVVRNMGTEERMAYSSALLSCGRRRVKLSTCPVAFGEISIRQRIRNVLNYRKPTLWICIAAVAAIVVVAVFFTTVPMQEYPPYYKQMMSLVGLPKETVTEELGIELIENEDSEYTGIYATPIQVEYQGITFDLELGFSVVDDRLWSVRYISVYESDINRAAEDTVTIAKRLQKVFGKATQNANKRTLWLSEIDVEGVLAKFENKYLEHEGIDTVGGYWDLTDEVGPQAKAYWESFVESEFWKTQFPRKNAHLVFGLTMSAWNDPYSDRTILYMEFDTGYDFETVVEYEN